MDPSAGKQEGKTGEQQESKKNNLFDKKKQNLKQGTGMKQNIKLNKSHK